MLKNLAIFIFAVPLCIAQRCGSPYQSYEEVGLLHDAAVARGKLYLGTGTHNHIKENREDVEYRKQLNNTHDFGQLVPAAARKWDATQPERGQFDFTGSDDVVNIAEANGQLMRCNSLVWHLSNPEWVTERSFDNATLIEIIKDHITEVLSYYKGRCYAWDVVNEAVYNNGSYRSSVFYDTIGPAYIPIAFAAAVEADPDAKLYYNDFAIELPSPKARATLEIVKMIQEYGVKVDGVGLQAHFDLSGMPPEAHFELGSMPTYDEMVDVMEQYTALGVEVAITEMDVSVLTPVTPANVTIYGTQAEVYYNATAACLTIEECVGITIWDWTDRYSWVPDTFPDLGNPLPWDQDLEKKLAYDGIMKAFKTFET